MMRLSALPGGFRTLTYATLLGLSLWACQEPTPVLFTQADVLKALQPHLESSYGFSFHAQMSYPPESEYQTKLHLAGSFLRKAQGQEWSTGERRIGDFPISSFFQETSDGFLHTWKVSDAGVPAGWSCDAAPRPPHDRPAPMYLYPHGGWSLMGQLVTMMDELGEAKVEATGKSLLFVWDTLEASKEVLLGEHYWIPGWTEGNPTVSRLHLEMAQDPCVPRRVWIGYSDGSSVEIDFDDFRFLEGDLETEAEGLRSDFAHDIPSDCSCKGRISDAPLPVR